MIHQAMVSSYLAGIGYDVGTKTAEVVWKDMSLDRYTDVPNEAYMALWAAEDKPAHLAQHFVGKYPVEKTRHRG